MILREGGSLLCCLHARIQRKRTEISFNFSFRMSKSNLNQFQRILHCYTLTDKSCSGSSGVTTTVHHLREGGELVQVTMKEMDEFYVFKSHTLFLLGTVLVAISGATKVLCLYQEKEISCHDLIRQEILSDDIISQEVNRFREWIDYTREGTPTLAM